MEIFIKEIADKQRKGEICDRILRDLPEWFGMPESRDDYVEKSRDKPFIACYTGDEAVGFIVLNATSEDCAEIFVMGVRKKYHRKGIGRRLCEAYETMARNSGFTYSQVKTVAMGHYDTYDDTNRFYAGMGYKKLECFPTLWDEWNPCQIYIKYLGR